MTKIITLSTGSNGYSAKQVAENAMTVADLIEQLQELAEYHGDDAVVVIRGYGRGAVYEPVVVANEPDDEDDEDRF
jgi:hypothetical protein